MKKLAFMIAFAGLTSAASAQPLPSPEQLAAAAVSAADLRAENVPDDWTDDAADFTGPMAFSTDDSGFITYVTTNLDGWPVVGSLSAYSAVNLFSDAAAAAKAFHKRQADDIQAFGPLVSGPKVGDASRYHAQDGAGGQKASTALRVLHGRYLLMVESESTGDAPLSPEILAKLAAKVIARLDSLDAGKLPAPELPKLAGALPPADAMAAPVLGTISRHSDAWAWDTDQQSGVSALSPSLRQALREEVGPAMGVTRTYAVAGLPHHWADVSMLPFRDRASAQSFVARHGEIFAESGAEAHVHRVDGDTPYYTTTFTVGNVAVQVDCEKATPGGADPKCEAVVRDLARKADAGLRRG